MRTLTTLLFPGFELLDVFGPLEMFGLLQDDFRLVMAAEEAGPVPSRQGPATEIDVSFHELAEVDILLVPGGMGTRREVDNARLIGQLSAISEKCRLVLSVCTGSALLAKAGILDGRKATTNKMAFHWVEEQGPKVLWQRQARWVEDGKFFTSSGISAGIDMSLAVIAHLHGEERAEEVARIAEYEWHREAGWDPFAKVHGLV